MGIHDSDGEYDAAEETPPINTEYFLSDELIKLESSILIDDCTIYNDPSGCVFAPLKECPQGYKM